MQLFRGLPTPSRPAPRAQRHGEGSVGRQAAHGRAVAIGSFDGLHLGHQAMLRAVMDDAETHGLCSGLVTFHPHPRAVFRPDQPPGRILPRRDQFLALRTLGLNELHLLPFNTALAKMPAEDFVTQVLVSGLQVASVWVGSDFRFGAKRGGDVALLERMGQQLGFRTQTLPTVLLDGERVSSTRLREALRNGHMEEVRRLLGRPYQLSGHVAHGAKIGRTLGIPTLNIRMPEDLQASGIYAVRVHGLGDRPIDGVASLGRRPVVEDQGRLLLEVHLFNWEGDAYGHAVSVDLLAFLRPELPYTTLDDMMVQVRQDIADAQETLNALNLP